MKKKFTVHIWLIPKKSVKEADGWIPNGERQNEIKCLSQEIYSTALERLEFLEKLNIWVESRSYCPIKKITSDCRPVH